MNRKRVVVLLLSINICFLLVYRYLVINYQPIAIIVPHHDIVRHKRLEFFRQVARKRPATKSIIILSPDHFSPNQNVISYSDKTWNLSNGDLEYDGIAGKELTSFLSKNNEIVASDHGIYNLLPDIKEVWLGAKVVPIIIGQRVKLTQLGSLINQINRSCKDSCLLIASVDFSHYLPKTLADIHDAKSLSVLANNVTTAIGDLEVDSPQALYVLNNYINLKNADSWNLFYHSNSGEMLGDRDIESTSHFFGWYQRELGQKQSFFSSTFLVGHNINPKVDRESLGDRFFYGVDYYNGKLVSSYRPTTKVIIQSKEKSTVQFLNGGLNISLGNDLAVGGFATQDHTVIVFLPLSRKGSHNILMQGEEKTKYLKQLLLNLENNHVYELDIYNGRIIL